MKQVNLSLTAEQLNAVKRLLKNRKLQRRMRYIRKNGAQSELLRQAVDIGLAEIGKTLRGKGGGKDEST